MSPEIQNALALRGIVPSEVEHLQHVFDAYQLGTVNLDEAVAAIEAEYRAR